MIRFEILLPLFYNDGRPIEPEKFVTTDDELVRHFSATATETLKGRFEQLDIWITAHEIEII